MTLYFRNTILRIWLSIAFVALGGHLMASPNHFLSVSNEHSTIPEEELSSDQNEITTDTIFDNWLQCLLFDTLFDNEEESEENEEEVDEEPHSKKVSIKELYQNKLLLQKGFRFQSDHESVIDLIAFNSLVLHRNTQCSYLLFQVFRL